MEEHRSLRSQVKYRVVFFLLKVVRKILGHDYQAYYSSEWQKIVEILPYQGDTNEHDC